MRSAKRFIQFPIGFAIAPARPHGLVLVLVVQHSKPALVRWWERSQLVADWYPEGLARARSSRVSLISSERNKQTSLCYTCEQSVSSPTAPTVIDFASMTKISIGLNTATWRSSCSKGSTVPGRGLRFAMSPKKNDDGWKPIPVVWTAIVSHPRQGNLSVWLFFVFVFVLFCSSLYTSFPPESKSTTNQDGAHLHYGTCWTQCSFSCSLTFVLACFA